MIRATPPTRGLQFLLLVAVATGLIAACGGPDVAQAAVNETCAALTHLQQERRLGRVDDTQYAKAYDDVRASLDASGARVDRPLDDAVAESCPSGWHDAIATRGEISDQAKADLAQPYCDDLARIMTVHGERFARAYDNFLDSIVAASERLGRPYLLAELVGAHCPAQWLDGVARREKIREAEDAAERLRLREEREGEQQSTPTQSPIPTAQSTSVTSPELMPSAPVPFPTASFADQGLLMIRHYEDEGVYLFDIRTGTIEFIDFGLDFVESFDLSPDKRRLIISGDRSGANENKPKLFVFDIHSRELKHLETPECRPTSPKWSPSGSKILLRCPKSRILDLDIRKYNDISETPISAYQGDTDASLTFSPDETLVIGSIVVDRGEETEKVQVFIYDLEASSSKKFDLVEEGSTDSVRMSTGSRSLSHDGSKLAFSVTQWKGENLRRRYL